jgi:D-alanyl-lipoteichoic acid acyltransferase DltB (MBOAT superfamily)
MFFNSIEFALFLPVIFLLYWFVAGKNKKLQNYILLAASYYFYSCWDYRFLFLLIFSTFLDYFTGLKIFNAESKQGKKIWLFISIFINLGFLGFFKYYNFFVDSFATLLQGVGFQVNPWTLSIVLPVGISFYTFHGMSYVIDIYYGRAKPTTNFVDYSLFVSFFPLLVAGPIERATHLLPQVQNPRTFTNAKAVDGLRQILWGLFKKIVIADRCAVHANMIFDHSGQYSGSTLVLGAIFFAFQIYGDFSGYSDIALGTARLFGFELLKNFSYPYFSRDIAEFWRRWHISLSSWFRDYLYIPLGGSKGGLWMKIRNTFIIFLVSGFWHGASWTFVAWGALNAIYFLPLLLLNKNRSNLEIVAKGRYLPSLRDAISIAITFALTVFAWIFFRANNLHHAGQYIAGIFSNSLLHTPEVFPKKDLVYIAIFYVMEWLGREHNYAIEGISIAWPKVARWSFYYVLVMAIVFSIGNEQGFIYFQF